ncbi:COR domain-containing protein, partial [uncultured Rubinisphaera sp.]|uniref:COR domain-containing protein n=1 Tax=uncultured Rubinisphaera sp. TaxID=1678686 RepID=UPI0030D9B9CB
LQQLHCSYTSVSDLSPLAGLTSLQQLHCSYTSVSDLSPLVGLTSLQRLDCSGTSVSDLSPLAGLTSLGYLDLSRTAVRELLGAMIPHSCRSITANGVNFESFSCSLAESTQFSSLILYESRIPGIPPEILSHNNSDNCLPRLKDYFLDLDIENDPIPDIKLIVIGNGQIGKTQICRKLCGDDYDDSILSTHGIFVRDTPLTMSADEPQTLLNIWDFGGQELYHGTHALFLNSRAIFMVVWTPETETGEETQEDGFVFRNHPLRYWLDSVKQAASHACPILLVQTQCDTPVSDRPVPPVEADYLNSILGLKVVQYSAKTDRNRNSLNAALKDAVRDLRGSEGISAMGSGRMEVKNQLQTWRSEDAQREPQDRQHRTLTQDEFVSLCEKTGNVSSPASLLDYLHHAGIVFYREGLFNDQIILDQSWALDAIYTIFHRQKCVRQLQQRRGRFTRELLELLAWTDYSSAEQKLFLSMMESCGICFKHDESFPHEDEETEYIAPDLLPTREDSEAALAGRWNDTADGYERCWTYEFLPPGLVRTLISRIGRAAGKYAIYWKYGVWFYEATTDARAVLEQTMEGPYAGQIVLRTQGDNGQLLERISEWVKECHTNIRQLRFNVTGSTPAVRIKRRPENRDEIGEAEPVPSLKFTDQPRQPGDKRYCVSYAWKEERHQDPERAGKVQEFCDGVKSAGFRLIRDTTDVQLTDSLSRFMREIGTGDRIYIFLSNSYLMSPNCMYELLLIWQTSGDDPDRFRKRIRVLTTPDVKIDSIPDRLKHTIYWNQQKDEIETLFRQLPYSAIGGNTAEQFDRIVAFANRVTEILSHISDGLRTVDFDTYIEAMIEELKQENSDAE